MKTAPVINRETSLSKDEILDRYLKLHDRYLDVIEECIEKNEKIYELNTTIIKLGDMNKEQRIQMDNMHEYIDKLTKS